MKDDAPAPGIEPGDDQRPVWNRPNPGLRAWSPVAGSVLVALWLGLGAFSKFAKPSDLSMIGGEDGIPSDYVYAAVETVVVVLLLAFHRWKVAWACSAIMFGGFMGYSLFTTIYGRDCGCFGALYVPPRGLTLGMATVFMLMSVGIARLCGGGRGLLVPTIVGVVAVSGVGWVFASTVTPPATTEVADEHGGKLAMERLLESPLLEDIRTQDPLGPSWYIFVWSEDCSVCEELQPVFEFDAETLAMEGDPTLQVRLFTKHELRDALGIELFAWHRSPVSFLVQPGGVITHQWGGYDCIAPTTLRDQMLDGTLEPQDPATFR